MKNKFNLSLWALQNSALVNYFTIIAFVFGTFAYFSLGQNEDPPFTFRAMVVETEWPGADALQMSMQVSDPIERALQKIPQREKITSFARSGISTVIIEIRGDIKPNDVKMIWLDVRKKVNDIQNLLPNGVLKSRFNDDFGDTYGTIFGLRTSQYDFQQIDNVIKKIRYDLLSLNDVAKVEIFGQEPEVVYIELSRRNLSKFDLSIENVKSQIKKQNSIYLSGELDQQSYIFPIRLENQFKSIDEIKNFRIKTNEDVIKLDEISKVFQNSPSPFVKKIRFNGEQIVGIGVSMRKGGDIVTLGKELKNYMELNKKNLPVGMQIIEIQDQSKVVSETIGEFIKAFFDAVLIVLTVSLVVLGIKKENKKIHFRVIPGIVVFFSVPLVMFFTFLIMNLFQISLNKISLGALIISLGLLVDDAIIVVEMIFRKLDEGKNLIRSVISSYEITAKPMLIGTLITASGFLPIGIAKSTVGEYTFGIFAVTTISLLCSWIVAVVFVPIFSFWLIKNFGKKFTFKKNNKEPTNQFKSFLFFSFKNKLLIIFLGFAIIFFGFFLMSKVENQFFPKSSRVEILVDIFLPEGSSPDLSEKTSVKAEKIITEIEGVKNITTFLGSGAPRFFLPLDFIFPQSRVSQLIVIPKIREDRDRIRDEIKKKLSSQLSQARVRVKVLPNGPPVNYPVVFRLTSTKFEDLLEPANRIAEVMKSNSNLRNVHHNWNEKQPFIKVNINKVRASELGLSPEVISNELQLRSRGVLVGEYKEGTRLIPIVMRLSKEERDNLADLRGILIKSKSGDLIPIEKVANFEILWEPSVIYRRNNAFMISIQADIDGNFQGETLSKEVLRDLEGIRNNLPQGVTFEVGGISEESNKGRSSIANGFPLMIFIIFTLLVFQLSSLGKTGLVFITAPLGISGAGYALFITSEPMGFVAMLGIIALMGMVIRNSLILVDQIGREEALGLDLKTAIMNASASRFRPIILTVITAVLAMIPLTNSIFWGPMAYSIMGGLILATLLTLILLPVFYYICYGGK